MLYNILLVFEVMLAIGLVAFILLQQGKGADAGAAFGSGASGTVFGSRGSANFLSRTTAILATLFFLNCLALAYMIANRGDTDEYRSVVEQGDSVMNDAAADSAPAPVVDPAADIPVSAPAADDAAAPADIPAEAPSVAPAGEAAEQPPVSTRPADIPE